jgi:excisionase family DNA binding protein
MCPLKPNLTRQEIARVFDGDLAAKFPPILSPGQLAELLGLSTKTIYVWIADGRLDGAFRRRGKHCLIWRDRAIDVIFNGPQWSD